ncbi:C40 family peptidase [Reichenbachiella versicolor]|uniref:C40 family peptidase n=1 Tax=Reichenbachiella versicolor TaxID=1821036 RepID=UPI0013A534B8|nr:NlpC/P60 family protein [Reichenbachiella versicolor]
MKTRAEGTADQVSQLLYGEHYEVISSQREWYKVKQAYDGSVGWILISQHKTIPDEFYKQLCESDFQICVNLSGSIQLAKKKINVLLGSVVPVTSNGLFQDDQVTFDGASKLYSEKMNFDQLSELLDMYQGSPYQKGGKTIFGIDESGFIQQVFRIGGYYVPRTLDEIRYAGNKVKGLEDLKCGDVVIAGEKRNQLGFVYLGDGQFTGVIEGQVRKISNPEFVIEKIDIRRFMV